MLRMQVIALTLLIANGAVAADWPEQRGPNRDGKSAEKNLPVKWSPAGENLAWKAPYGGRSAPIVMGDRVCMLNPVGKDQTLQERVMCLDAETGKVAWEYKFNVYLSDVPPHRVAWSSPAGDPETGNIYAFGVGGTLVALSRDGKVLWERSLAEEYGLVTTHGGRTVSPVVDGALVIISGVTTGWGDQSRAAHRFYAFDKKTGQPVWASSPGGRPFDTTYSSPVVADVAGQRLFIAGGSDGAMHAIKAATGEPVWKYLMSKRGLNTGPVLDGATVVVTHSEENYESSEMGLMAAIDGTAKGEIQKQGVKWAVTGRQNGFSSPVIDGKLIYQVDNGGNLFAYDTATGKQIWSHNLGTIQKASPVLADGKLYVGTENGKFFIVRPKPDGAEVLDEDQLEGEQIIGSAAVADGRVYMITTDNLYAIGKRTAAQRAPVSAAKPEPGQGAVAHVQVVPAELLLKPGEKTKFEVRLFDANGRPLAAQNATWAVERLTGAVQPDGSYAAAAKGAEAGLVKATVGSVTGTARVRVIPPLPLTENFDSITAGEVPRHWINTLGKAVVRDLDGTRVLAKLADNPFTKRARMFFGHSDMKGYTVEVDVRALEMRRQLGDAGVVAQRYQLTMYGNHQRLQLESWQPETTRTVQVPFAWKSDTWYRLKLRVEPTADGKVKALGKAWPKSEPEPDKWQIERVDPIPNLQGSPGIYADAPFEVFFDNLKVTPNS